MKSKIATTLFSLAAATGFSQEAIMSTTYTQETPISLPTTTLNVADLTAANLPSSNPVVNLPLTDAKIADVKMDTKILVKNSFTYLRMGVADPDANYSVQAFPGFGLGYRYGMDQSAVDISLNYTRDGKVDGRETFTYTAPRVSYMRYVSNDIAPQSFYYGAGLAWGVIAKGNPNDFQGLVGSASLGYAMNRNQNFVSFIQLDVSQPVVGISSVSYSYQNTWRPLVEASVGLGY